MSDELSNPNGGGMTGGGTTAADNLRGTLTPGAGNIDGVPVANDDRPGEPTETGPGRTGVVPSGGGSAVPQDRTIEGMDNDAGGFGDGDDAPTLPATPEGEGSRAAIAPSDTPTDNGGLLPTSGLSGGGTNEA